MNLPEDIIRDILLRLPVKLLLRFTSVSKRWRDLILSDGFINSHTKFGRRMEIIFSSGINYGCKRFRSSVDGILQSYFESMALSETCQLKDNFEVIGHCNGIMCLNCNWTRPAIILLWNPTLHQCRALSPPDNNFAPGLRSHRAGFGYDALNHDYKVVTFTSLGLPNLMVYSLKNDSWKSINGSSLKLGRDYSISHPVGGLFFEGRLYWIWSKYELEKPTYYLLVFDLAKEEFLEFGMSDTFNYSENYIWDALGIFRGCISLILTPKQCNGKMENSFQVWSMEDHFIPQSWTKIVDSSSGRLDVDKEVLSYLGFMWDSVNSTGLTRNGKLYAEVLKDGDNYLALYNVETQKLDVRYRKGSPAIEKQYRWYPISDFIETLVEVIPKNQCSAP